MEKNFKILIAYIFISLLVLVLGINVFAVTEEELRNKQDEINQKIESANTEIAGIKENMTDSLDQINRLNVQIKECEDALATTTGQLDTLTKDLDEKKKELEIAQENYNKQKELVDKRLITIYENKNMTYLEVLLGSRSFSDFLTRYYILEELAKYDNKFLQSLEVYSDAVEIKNSIVESKKTEVENTKNTLEAKAGAMEVLLNDKTHLISTLSEREKELNNELEQFEIDKKEIEKELIEYLRANPSSRNLKPSESGYICPLPGKSRADITTGFNGYAGHTGVDFATPLGTDVLAVKDGTVVISNALKYSNGNYRSYGEYIVIDHHDGTMTLYAHGTPNSRAVQVNDEVVQRTSNNEIWFNWKLYWTTFTF